MFAEGAMVGYKLIYYLFIIYEKLYLLRNNLIKFQKKLVCVRFYNYTGEL